MSVSHYRALFSNSTYKYNHKFASEQSRADNSHRISYLASSDPERFRAKEKETADWRNP